MKVEIDLGHPSTIARGDPELRRRVTARLRVRWQTNVCRDGGGLAV
jgi:hypothetical protein